MGEIESLWNYAEHQDMDQLGQKLLCTTLELEKLKSEKMEEMKKYNDYVNKLIVVLKSAIQERDEARSQLENLISKIMSTTNPDPFPPFQPVKANSSVTESNSLSETYNYGSPPVDSLFHPQEFPNLSIHDEPDPKMDRESFIIESLAKGKVLPQRGMFVQAIIDAGPLLQTRLMAGPLPNWRNPPQLQPFQIPPVSIGAAADKPPSSSSSSGSGYGYGYGYGYANFGCVRDNDCFGMGKRLRFC